MGNIAAGLHSSLTNNFSLPAQVIADLYRCRWPVPGAVRTPRNGGQFRFPGLQLGRCAGPAPATVGTYASSIKGQHFQGQHRGLAGHQTHLNEQLPLAFAWKTPALQPALVSTGTTSLMKLTGRIARLKERSSRNSKRPLKAAASASASIIGIDC